MRLLAMALCLALASAASADETVSNKQAYLEAKKAFSAPSKAEKAKNEKRLAKLVGKPPAPIIVLRNGWTDETLAVDAKPDATVTRETWNLFLRDHWTNQPTQMEIRLVGVLVKAALRFKKDRVDIVSGYRSPKFNLMLRKKGHEVARQSQHSEGNAVDFRLPGVPTTTLLSFVKSLHLGGAGFYPESAFVHADTGPIRYWTGR